MIAAMLASPAVAAAAQADPARRAAGNASDITGVVVADGSSTLALNFDDPEPAADAQEIKSEVLDSYGPAAKASEVSITLVREDAAAQATTSRPTVNPVSLTGARARRAGARLSCGNTWTASDSNGRIRLSYRCDLSPKRVQWDYKLAICAIVVSPVKEQGLRWWRGGVSQPQNAPHTEGCLYNWHGTMNPVPVLSSVDYQDHFTFRHNVGSGGSGSVTFAGSYTSHQCEECP